MTLCGCVGCAVMVVCVCSVQYCRHEGVIRVIHIYMSMMVCVSLKRRIGVKWLGGEGGGWEANTVSVLARRKCAAAVQQKADETLWRAQLDVWLSNFRGQSFATRESLQMTDLPLARASTEDAVVHRPFGVRGVYYIIAYCCSCIIYSYRSAVLQISTLARRWPLLSHALDIVCGGNLRLVNTARRGVWC